MEQYSHIRDLDTEMFELITQEQRRQKVKLEMIASENYTSNAVMEATGSILTNKYAEGYPEKRYYGGCEVVDKIEQIAIDRANMLFGAEYSNVQPHCGSSANLAIYAGFLNHGDTVLGMDLAQGGHLTHGSPASFSGKFYHIVSYGSDKNTELIDYEQVAELARIHKPKMIIAGASSYSRIIDFEKFAAIAKEYHALLMVDMAHIAGLVAAGIHPSPLPHADVVTSTTHKTLRGPRGGLILVGKNIENKLGVTNAKGKIRKYSAIINSIIFPGIQGGPLMHVIAGKAIALKECMRPSFVVYQKQVVRNAQALASFFIKEGIRVVSGGTDTHLLQLDLRVLGITGKQAEEWLDNANISVNKNAIPFDPQSPNVTSGIRIGTPALTTRGMNEEDMNFVGNMITRVLRSEGKEYALNEIAKEVALFTEKHGVLE